MDCLRPSAVFLLLPAIALRTRQPCCIFASLLPTARAASASASVSRSARIRSDACALARSSGSGAANVVTRMSREAGLERSVGSVGDSYDNALPETNNGLYKAEVIWRRGPWRNFEQVELATLEWVGWFNNKCRFRFQCETRIFRSFREFL